VLGDALGDVLGDVLGAIDEDGMRRLAAMRALESMA
jgi:hypothetical protein